MIDSSASVLRRKNFWSLLSYFSKKKKMKDLGDRGSDGLPNFCESIFWRRPAGKTIRKAEEGLSGSARSLLYLPHQQRASNCYVPLSVSRQSSNSSHSFLDIILRVYVKLLGAFSFNFRSRLGRRLFSSKSWTLAVSRKPIFLIMRMHAYVCWARIDESSSTSSSDCIWDEGVQGTDAKWIKSRRRSVS